MSDYLQHHGTKGQKWGVRKYQNPDGSLTAMGRVHYHVGQKMDTNSKSDSAQTRRVKQDYNELDDAAFKAKYKVSKNIYRHRVNKYGDPAKNSPLAKYGRSHSTKKGLSKVVYKQALAVQRMKDFKKRTSK